MQNYPILDEMLWRDHFPKEALKLIKEVKLEVMDDPLGRRVSNVGGWQSKDDLHTRPNFKEFVELMELQAVQIHSELNLIDEVEFKICNMWANQNWKGAHNSYHQHINPPSQDRISSTPIISGVFYISVPENSGDIVFLNEDLDYSKMSLRHNTVMIPEFCFKKIEDFHIRKRTRITPKQGELLMFFADIFHGVEENNNANDARISIAFNLGLQLKK
jgi:uncharacterized protein (TIGR02466 family)